MVRSFRTALEGSDVDVPSNHPQFKISKNRLHKIPNRLFPVKIYFHLEGRREYYKRGNVKSDDYLVKIGFTNLTVILMIDRSFC